MSAEREAIGAHTHNSKHNICCDKQPAAEGTGLQAPAEFSHICKLKTLHTLCMHTEVHFIGASNSGVEGGGDLVRSLQENVRILA